MNLNKFNLNNFFNIDYYSDWMIGWRKSNIIKEPIFGKLLYASTCTCNLILCQDYSSMKFYACIEVCLKNSTDFSESGWIQKNWSIDSNY